MFVESSVFILGFVIIGLKTKPGCRLFYLFHPKVHLQNRSNVKVLNTAVEQIENLSITSQLFKETSIPVQTNTVNEDSKNLST